MNSSRINCIAGATMQFPPTFVRNAMQDYHYIATPLLDVAYLEWNPSGSRCAVLVHG